MTDVCLTHIVTFTDCQKRPLLKENKTGSVLNLKYNSGCEGDCIPDLIVSAEFREKDHQGVWSTTESLLVGSSRSLELIATVGNRGDPAHNSELQLSLPPCLSISQAGLTEVDQQRYSLGTVAGRTNKTVSFKLQVKVELVNFSVPLLIVSLNVSSGGKEAKPADNAASVSLALQRDNLLEVKAGMSYPAELTLHGDQTSIQLVHSYVLENSGVSPIDTWSMDIRLPANLSFGTQNASLLHVRRPEVKVWQRSESGAVDDTESCLIVNDFKFEGDQRRVRRAAPEPLQLQDRSVSCSEGSHLEVRCMDIMCSYQHTLYPGGYASLNITLALDVPLLLQAERARWPLKLMSEVEARAGTGVQHTSNASTLLHRQPESGANLAVWLPCLAGALLLLLALALLLYKCGFLRRNRLRGGGGELLMTAELNSPSRHDHYQEQEKEH